MVAFGFHLSFFVDEVDVDGDVCMFVDASMIETMRDTLRVSVCPTVQICSLSLSLFLPRPG